MHEDTTMCIVSVLYSIIQSIPLCPYSIASTPPTQPPSTTPTPSLTPTLPPPDASPNAGAIAGGVIGGLIGVIIIVLIVIVIAYLIWKKKSSPSKCSYIYRPSHPLVCFQTLCVFS